MAMELLGYTISDMGVEADIEYAFNYIAEKARCKYMACANPHSLVVAAGDRQFENALKDADILVPDGSGIVWAARFLHQRVLQKVAGFDFFYHFCKLADHKKNIRFFFLGSSEHVLNLIKNRLDNEFPKINVCGTYSPPFRDRFTDQENQKMIDAVNRARPDVLWVGMTAPKQEKWIWSNRKFLDVPFAAAIGAVFDFYAGTKKRSSEIWIKLGLEWLPRFLKEPKRLWERNLKSTPIFLWWIFKEKLRLNRKIKDTSYI